MDWHLPGLSTKCKKLRTEQIRDIPTHITMKKKHRITILNIAFFISCGVILLFLLKAPDETTARLPQDQDHERFFSIASKKEAEKFCGECHTNNNIAPLPLKHPPKYRCLFCHKR